MVGELRWSCYIILFIIFKAPLKDEIFLSSVAFEELVWLFIRLSELCIYIWFSMFKHSYPPSDIFCHEQICDR